MGNKWVPLIVLTIGHFVNDFYQYIIPLLLPFLVPEFGFSYFSGGILVASYLGVTMVMNPIIGRFADHHRKRKLIMCLGLAFLSIFTSALSLANSYLTLLILSLAIGVGFSTFHPQSTKFIQFNYREKMGRYMGLHGMGGGAGLFATPVIMVPLLNTLGWRTALSFIFIPGCLAALMLWIFLKEAETEPNRNLPGVKLRPLILLSTVHGLSGFVFRGFINFLPLYFVVVRATDVIQMGLLTGLVLATALIAEPLGGSISDRIGRRKMYMISMIIMMLSLLAFTNSSGPISVLWLILIGFWAQAVMPVGLTFASELGPEERAGTCVGIVYGASMGLSLISTLIVGYLIDSIGFYWSFMALSFFAGFAAILTRLLPTQQITNPK